MEYGGEQTHSPLLSQSLFTSWDININQITPQRKVQLQTFVPKGWGEGGGRQR
jgi:hypothetical protein